MKLWQCSLKALISSWMLVDTLAFINQYSLEFWVCSHLKIICFQTTTLVSLWKRLFLSGIEIPWRSWGGGWLFISMKPGYFCLSSLLWSLQLPSTMKTTLQMRGTRPPVMTIWSLMTIEGRAVWMTVALCTNWENVFFRVIPTVPVSVLRMDLFAINQNALKSTRSVQKWSTMDAVQNAKKWKTFVNIMGKLTKSWRNSRYETLSSVFNVSML